MGDHETSSSSGEETSDSGKESLLWHGIEDGKAVTYESEPYVGRGTKAAAWLIRWLPVDWLL